MIISLCKYNHNKRIIGKKCKSILTEWENSKELFLCYSHLVNPEYDTCLARQ